MIKEIKKHKRKMKKNENKVKVTIEVNGEVTEVLEGRSVVVGVADDKDVTKMSLMGSREDINSIADYIKLGIFSESIENLDTLASEIERMLGNKFMAFIMSKKNGNINNSFNEGLALLQDYLEEEGIKRDLIKEYGMEVTEKDCETCEDREACENLKEEMGNFKDNIVDFNSKLKH